MDCSRQPRQVAAFGVGVACEENLEAEGVSTEHIMVRQLAGHEEGRALRRGQLEEARPAARAHGEALVRADRTRSGPRPLDSTTSECRLKPVRDFGRRRRPRKPRDPPRTHA